MSAEVVLITGGTGSIGAALCLEFSKLDRYTLVANCPASDRARSKAVLDDLSGAGCNVQLACFDVTDTLECQEAIDNIETNIGPISILINAAGITRDAKLSKMTPEFWNDVLSTNLDGVFNVTRPCIEPMIHRGYGRIVNISSVNGQRGQIGQTNYSAAKAGMTGFTKALAREVARDGITVNSISPGYVNSPMIQAIPEKIRDKLVKDIPVGRFAEASEIARAVAFLADENSGYITGTDLSVNGGYHIA